MEDWEELMRTLGLFPVRWGPPAQAVLILDSNEDLGELPELAKRLYAWPREQGNHLEWPRPSIPSPAKRIFRFRKDQDVPIITSAYQNDQGVFNTAPHDWDSAGELVQQLSELGQHGATQRRQPVSPAPEYARRSLIIVGGPHLNSISAEVNRFFAREDTWFRGFYFREAEPCEECRRARPQAKELKRGEIRCHILPDASAIERRRHASPDSPDFYPRLPDGRAEDFGLVYCGVHPLDPAHWLVLVAGLSGPGIVGAVRALTTAPALELIARGLQDRRHYCSAFIRTRFRDFQDTSDGSLSLVAVVRGHLTPAKSRKKFRIASIGSWRVGDQ
jgi:hypothetical protein